MLQDNSHTDTATRAPNDKRDILISVKNLHKSFGDNHVLRGFDLTLYDEENLMIIGKSGSGKSVLLKCIIRLNIPDSGELMVLGKNVPELSREEMDRLRADVGFLFQGSALYDSMTVRENLEFPLRRHLDRLGTDDIDKVVMEALESVGLAHAIDLMPAELSGGMKRRVALARTIILKPKIILYDEPSSGLDPITAKEISQLILDIQKQYKTASLIISHDMDFARIISNRVIMLIDGINYASGTFDALSKSQDPKIKAFFK
ncbi:MAG: ATP-binding cassette domain-containing protein [Saprospiraceae bacterium]|nr:ATP-binding cassette domain-containing protein [Saprospiraceae bacterium]